MPSTTRSDDRVDTTCESFATAASRTVRFLRHHLGFAASVVLRRRGDDAVILAADDEAYDLRVGGVVKWTGSLCAAMASGAGPRIAPDVEAVPAFRREPVRRNLAIGAYAGYPLADADGNLFGSLCALDPWPRPTALVSAAPVLETVGALLNAVLVTELRVLDEQRRADHAETETLLDPVTGVSNRRGWDLLLRAEEARCRRYGHGAAVVVVDVGGAAGWDQPFGSPTAASVLRRSAEALRAGCRVSDVVARIDDTRFAVLAVECDGDGVQALLGRLDGELRDRALDATMAAASRTTDPLHVVFEMSVARLASAHLGPGSQGEAVNAGSRR